MTSRLAITQQLEALELFMGTAACANMLKSLEQDIVGVRESIIATPPVDDASRSHVLMLHGTLQTLVSNRKLFEAARDSLKDALVAIDDQAEQQVAQQ